MWMHVLELAIDRESGMANVAPVVANVRQVELQVCDCFQERIDPVGLIYVMVNRMHDGLGTGGVVGELFELFDCLDVGFVWTEFHNE